MSNSRESEGLDRDLHRRVVETTTREREVDVVGRVLQLAAAHSADDRAWALVRLAADLRTLDRLEEALKVLDVAWQLAPSDQPELAIFTCAIAIHCDNDAHGVAVTLEEDFVDRGIDLRFARACERLYAELYEASADDAHLARLHTYRAHIELFESSEASSVAA